jgi:glucose-1-phosphate cytidylyltransferase
LEIPLANSFYTHSMNLLKQIDNDQTILENKPLRYLVWDIQFAVYQHKGFWQCIETMTDLQLIMKNWLI